MESFQFWEKRKSTSLHLTTSFSRHSLDGLVKELSPGLLVNPGASMVTHHLTTHFSRGLIWSIASYHLDRETPKEISEQLATVPTDRDAPTTVPSPGEF